MTTESNEHVPCERRHLGWRPSRHWTRGESRIAALVTAIVALTIPFEAQSEERAFVPDQVIVKFHDDVARHAPRALAESFRRLSGRASAESLDRDLERSGARRMSRAFRAFDERRGQLAETARARVQRGREQRARRGRNLPPPRTVPKLENIFILELEPGQDVESVARRLARNPHVEYAHPNYIFELDSTPLPSQPFLPDDPYVTGDGTTWSEGAWGQPFLDLYGLHRTRTLEAWDHFDLDGSGAFEPGERKPGEGIVVAVVDTGIDVSHPDLAANVLNPGEDVNGNGVADPADWNGVDDDGNGFVDDLHGWDFVGSTGTVTDPNGHGTHVAGTIAAIADNAAGVAGVAPWAKVVSARSHGPTGSGTCPALCDAVLYAADVADIISNSWGGPGVNLFVDIFDYAAAQGALSVAAAGNDSSDVGTFSPAGQENVLAVAASDDTDVIAGFSNTGAAVDVTAPGVNVLSLNANGGNNAIATSQPSNVVGTDYLRISGTSMACPHVSGAAAVLWSWHDQATAYEIWHRIRAGAADIESLNPGLAGLYGTGRLDIAASMTVVPTSDLMLSAETLWSGSAGDTVEIVASVFNFGLSSGNVTLTLASSHPDVSIVTGSVGLGAIGTGQTVGNEATPLVLGLAPSASPGAEIPATLTMQEAGGDTVVRNLTIEVSQFIDIDAIAQVPTIGFGGFPDAMFDDFDGDGLSDIHFNNFGSGASDREWWYRSNGDGTFDSATADLGLPSSRESRMVLLFDYDNDGDKDILTGETSTDPEDLQRLLRNDGNVTWTDVNGAAGLTNFGLQSMAAIDLDGDGFTDVVGTPYWKIGPPGPANQYAPFTALHNNGDGTFSDVSAATGIPTDVLKNSGAGPVERIVALDVDRDHDIDLVLKPWSRDTTVWLNSGTGTFTDATTTVLPGLVSRRFWALATGDVDGDGDVDLLVSGWFDGASTRNAILANDGNGVFTELAGIGDLGQGGRAAPNGLAFNDYDNDGDVDLLLTGDVVYPKLYQNDGAGSFTDVSAAALPNWVVGYLSASTAGDIDGDGWIDFYVTNSSFGSGQGDGAVLQNGLPRNRNWLKVDLDGVVSARDGFGAHVTLTAGTIVLGQSLRSWQQDTSTLHFGLGTNTTVNEIEIRWPSGRVQKLANIPINRTVLAIEPIAACPNDADSDGDGVCDDVDVCLTVSDPGQVDADGDGVGDACDNCDLVPNGPLASTSDCNAQEDSDKDGFGNICDTDVNQDGAASAADLGYVMAAQAAAALQPELDFNCNGQVDASDLSRALADLAIQAQPGDYHVGTTSIDGGSGWACADPSIVAPGSFASQTQTSYGTSAPGKPISGTPCLAPEQDD